jgi:hypothetical protein
VGLEGSPTDEPLDTDPERLPDTIAAEGINENTSPMNGMAALDGMQQAMAVHWAKFFSAQLSENVPAKLIPAVLEELARMKLDDGLT